MCVDRPFRKCLLLNRYPLLLHPHLREFISWVMSSAEGWDLVVVEALAINDVLSYLCRIKEKGDVLMTAVMNSVRELLIESTHGAERFRAGNGASQYWSKQSYFISTTSFTNGSSSDRLPPGAKVYWQYCVTD